LTVLGSFILDRTAAAFVIAHLSLILPICLLKGSWLWIAAPTPLLLHLDLHLQALFLLFPFLFLGLLVQLDLRGDLVLREEANALVKDVEVHFNDLRLLHESWQSRVAALGELVFIDFGVGLGLRLCGSAWRGSPLAS